MGNCLFVEEKPIRIMKTDGKILEYKSPTRVFQILADFSAGHVISDAVPVAGKYNHQLQLPTAKLLSAGHLYYLIPFGPTVMQEKPKKAVRFAEPEKESETVGRGVVRVKLVVTKKELREMIMGADDDDDEIICKIKNGKIINSTSDEILELQNETTSLQIKWKPVLRTIPETTQLNA